MELKIHDHHNLGRHDSIDNTVSIEPTTMFCADEKIAEKYLFKLPWSFQYDGYIWPGFLMSQTRLEKLRDFQFQQTDIILCSYPKSGTTWTSEILSLIVNAGSMEKVREVPLHERVPWLEIDDTSPYLQAFNYWQGLLTRIGARAKEPVKYFDNLTNHRVFFTHLPVEMLPDSVLTGNCKIVYVARNPKDNAVSFFHYHRIARFLGLQKLTWNEFFDLYLSGNVYCGNWHEHVTGFWRYKRILENQGEDQRFLWLYYEDMKRDLRSEVRRIADFLGFHEFSDSIIENIAYNSTFGKMKNNSMVNRQGTWLFDESTGKFMRKGEVGDWQNYYSKSQNRLFDALHAERMRDYPDLKFRFTE